jgi:hypothetical protein
MDALIFLNLFQNLTVTDLLVVDDVLIDSETCVMISSISRICRLSLTKVFIEAKVACVFI